MTMKLTAWWGLVMKLLYRNLEIHTHTPFIQTNYKIPELTDSSVGTLFLFTSLLSWPLLENLALMSANSVANDERSLLVATLSLCTSAIAFLLSTQRPVLGHRQGRLSWIVPRCKKTKLSSLDPSLGFVVACKLRMRIKARFSI